MLLGLALAVMVGLSLGMLGGGGSVLTVPVLVYAMGLGAKQAIAASLPIVGITSLVGAAGHWRAGNIRVGIAFGFGAVAAVGAFAGARLAALFSGGAQLLLFAGVALAAAVAMVRRGPTAPGLGVAAHASLPVVGLAGLGVGVLTGLVGVGGGFLIVPALVLLAGVPMKQAVGTSLLVIAMNAAAGFAGYLGQVAIPWNVLAAFTACAVAGIVSGTYLVRFVSAEALRRGFALLLIVVSGIVFYLNRQALEGAL